MAEMTGAAIRGTEQCLRGACGPQEPHPRRADSLPDGGTPNIPAKSNGSPHRSRTEAPPTSQRNLMVDPISALDETVVSVAVYLLPRRRESRWDALRTHMP